MTDTIHRNVAVDDLDSAPAPSPTPDDHGTGRGRWVAAGVAIALGAGATVAFLALRDDDRNPPPTPTATTSAFSAEQRQAVSPAMQVLAHERQILQEAAERAQLAEWARNNGLTGLSPASVHGGAPPT